MHTKRTLFGLIAGLLIGLLASCGWADGTRMWYRGYFDGPVDVRTRPQPGYYYRPSPNTTVPLFEQSYSYPLICSHCGAYYYPGKRCCSHCDAKLPGRRQGIDAKTVYAPSPMPGQYYYKEQPHYRTLTATRNLGPRIIRYKHPWD